MIQENGRGWRRGFSQREISPTATFKDSNRDPGSRGRSCSCCCAAKSSLQFLKKWHTVSKFFSYGALPWVGHGPHLHGMDTAAVCPLWAGKRIVSNSLPPFPCRSGSLEAGIGSLCAGTVRTLRVLGTQKGHRVIIQSSLPLVVVLRRWYRGWKPQGECASRRAFPARGTCVREQCGQQRPSVLLPIASETTLLHTSGWPCPTILLLQLSNCWN